MIFFTVLEKVVSGTIDAIHILYAQSSPNGNDSSGVRASWKKPHPEASSSFCRRRVRKMSKMSQIKKVLIQKLVKKGLSQNMIPGFLRSLFNYFSADPQMDLLQINQKLQYIGWEEIQLDYHTFQLAKSCFETRGLNHKPKKTTLLKSVEGVNGDH